MWLEVDVTGEVKFLHREVERWVTIFLCLITSVVNSQRDTMLVHPRPRANGAQYDSQGQARSALPLEQTWKSGTEPQRILTLDHLELRFFSSRGAALYPLVDHW